jgi:RPA family protein
MNTGGYIYDDSGSNVKETTSTQKNRERGGLIPITIKIFNDSVINQDEALEYLGNNLSDVCIVGYLKGYDESDNKVRVKVWDQTGMVEVIFFNKSESEPHAGLADFQYRGETNKIVKVFGTVKTYRKEKSFQGAKIMFVDDNELIYHQLEVANDWLYLTGKFQSLKASDVKFIINIFRMSIMLM